jgi:hypothetical protein
MQESIYNLLSQFQKKTRNGVSYKSRYPYNIAPTASTFKLKTSSYPNVSNLSGDFTLPRGAHRLDHEYATFGLPIGSYAVDPKNYHKKGETFKILPPLEKLKCSTEIKKPPIPTLNDQPISGLRTEKNFVISNAVDNILMQPKKLRDSSVEERFHKYFGRVPDYIKKYRANHEQELFLIKEAKRKHQEEEDAKQRLLTEEEVGKLREGLKKKWQNYNNLYGKMTHKKAFDNLVLLRNKEDLERELNQIESDLKKLSFKNIVVDMTK